MEASLLTPESDVNSIVKGGGIAVIETSADSHARHEVMWRSTGADLTQAHIDALLAGHTLTFAVEEFQVFISMADEHSRDKL